VAILLCTLYTIDIVRLMTCRRSVLTKTQCHTTTIIIIIILDSEWNDKSVGFTVMGRVLNIFFIPVIDHRLLEQKKCHLKSKLILLSAY